MNPESRARLLDRLANDPQHAHSYALSVIEHHATWPGLSDDDRPTDAERLTAIREVLALVAEASGS